MHAREGADYRLNTESIGKNAMRLLQIGLGSWGRRWAELVQSTAGFAIGVIVETDPASRTWAVEHLALPSGLIFSTLDDALAGAEIDAALVTTPPETHRAVAEAALQAGLHVLVEKPLATTLVDAQAMAATAGQTGKTLMVSQNYRFTGMARTMRQTMLSGQIGDLVAVRIAFRRDTRHQFPAGDFRYQMKHPLVLDMAIHHFDLLRAITGLEPVAVDARAWHVPDSPYIHDPACAALITLSGDVPVIYDGDWATHEPDTSWNGDWEITGTAGRLTWRGETIRVKRWGEAPVIVDSGHEPVDGRTGVLAAFARAIAIGERAETDVHDNLQSLALTLGCVASVEATAPVSLEDGRER
ncbi:MAG: Gfo/Idh/MocA family protein [Thermomicrobiales bacterium]